MPRTPEQFEALREKSQQKILRAALECFANNGFHTTSMNTIAKQAGISVGLIYNYFESKNALLQAIILDGCTQISGMFEMPEDTTNPYEKMRVLLDAYFTSLRENIEFWKLYSRLLVQPDVMQALQETLATVFAEIFSWLEAYFQAIDAEDPQSEAKVLGAIFDGIGLHYMLDPEHYPLDAVKQLLLQKYAQPLHSGETS